MKRKGSMIISDLMAYILGGAAILVVGSLVVGLAINQAKSGQAKGDVGRFKVAISMFKNQTGNYPLNLETLMVKQGIYDPVFTIQSFPKKDPWGNIVGGIDGDGGGSPYCYAYTSNGFAVWAIGKDSRNNSGGAGHTLPSGFSGDDVGDFGQ